MVACGYVALGLIPFLLVGCRRQLVLQLCWNCWNYETSITWIDTALQSWNWKLLSLVWWLVNNDTIMVPIFFVSVFKAKFIIVLCWPNFQHVLYLGSAATLTKLRLEQCSSHDRHRWVGVSVSEKNEKALFWKSLFFSSSHMENKCLVNEGEMTQKHFLVSEK